MYCSGCCGTWSVFVLVGRVSLASGLLEWVGADILLRFILHLVCVFPFASSPTSVLHSFVDLTSSSDLFSLNLSSVFPSYVFFL